MGQPRLHERRQAWPMAQRCGNQDRQIWLCDPQWHEDSRLLGCHHQMRPKASSHEDSEHLRG